MSTELVMLSNHLILCCPLLLLPSIFSMLWPPDMKSRLTGKDQLVYRGINWLQKWLWEMQNGTASLEDSGAVSWKIKHALTIWSRNPASWFLPKYPWYLLISTFGMSCNHVHTRTCRWAFLAALFLTAKTWKQPRCSSLSKWINKLVYPGNKILFSTNELNSKWASKWRHGGTLISAYN